MLNLLIWNKKMRQEVITSRLARSRRGMALGAVLLLQAFAIIPASAADIGGGPYPEIEWGYPDQPPRAFTNAKGEVDGHYARLLRELLGRAGMSWHGARYPAPRLMQNLQQGTTNFSVLVKNPVLDECCIYSREPVWYDDLTVYYIGEKPPIRRKDDLVGKKVITMAGFSYGGLISFLNDPANKIITLPAKTHQSAFAMLEAGRADYVLDYAEVAESEALKDKIIADLRHDVVERIHMYLVIVKSYPNAKAVLDRLEGLYAALFADDVKRDYTKK